MRLVYVHCLEIQVENHCWLESPFLTAQQLHSHEAAMRVAAIQALKAWKVAKFPQHQWLDPTKAEVYAVKLREGRCLPG